MPTAQLPRFVDNLDGTITDKTTCLTWEKKTGTVGASVDCSATTCSDPYNVNNVYLWSSTGTLPNGDAFLDFLARVNGTLCDNATTVPTNWPCPSLGGHTDWRLPTLAEFQTIFAAPFPCFSPCIDPIFGPTVGGVYWSSSTSLALYPAVAWIVHFGQGGADDCCFKSSNKFYVRAVRGGK